MNGQKVESDEVFDNAVLNILYETGKDCCVEISYKKSNYMEMYKRKALRVLQEAEGIYEYKDQLYFALRNAERKEEIVEAINASLVQKQTKDKLKEIL